MDNLPLMKVRFSADTLHHAALYRAALRCAVVLQPRLPCALFCCVVLCYCTQRYDWLCNAVLCYAMLRSLSWCSVMRCFCNGLYGQKLDSMDAAESHLAFTHTLVHTIVHCCTHTIVHNVVHTIVPDILHPLCIVPWAL